MTQVVRITRSNPLTVTALVAVVLVSFVHPALGLFVLILSHIACCHTALCSSSGSKELLESGNKGNPASMQFIPKYGFSADENNSHSPNSTRSFAETQLEIFHHRHGLLILHLLAALMFVPSLVAWIQYKFSCSQRIGTGQSFPWFLDSALCIGVVLHGICDSKPEFNFFWFPVPGIPGWEIRLSFAYFLAGFFSYLCALALAPYRGFYAMAAIGVISFAFRIIQTRNRKKGEACRNGRSRHSHRH
ncbi:hypothetical protein M9H77_37144 [Catharanthus roseus]|uniref:Uncharacterized protein n=1 Tax=Catharanthus roseus TaxID=4058 RepID=A0ACB9ZTT9_CATRO|nr:hypothetical protein M9H77_37144 [Catharanthus roseus]